MAKRCETWGEGGGGDGDGGSDGDGDGGGDSYGDDVTLATNPLTLATTPPPLTPPPSLAPRSCWSGTRWGCLAAAAATGGD